MIIVILTKEDGIFTYYKKVSRSAEKSHIGISKLSRQYPEICQNKENHIAWFSV